MKMLLHACRHKSKDFVPDIILPNRLKTRRSTNIFLHLWRGTHTNTTNLWVEPAGHDTGITIYNSSSRSKVPFKVRCPGIVTWYNCGPTVYDSAHIGHAVCYVKLDIIRRILQNIFQLNVIQVTGITDVDDKINNRAKELKINALELTHRYENEFMEDMKKLNVLQPSLTPRVTEHIPQIVLFIENIMKKGCAYNVGEGTIYFDTTAYGRYGKLKLIEHEVQRIVSDDRKKSSKDFALWRGAKEADSLSWDSPWGPGRPGWHIECSVMASKIFGEQLDLHSGGMDLMFPHHENEEAQCCAHFSCEQWCNYWIHIGHLHLKDSTKMSKSLKNTVTVDSFLQDYSSNLFRIFCLFSNYRTIVEYDSTTMTKSIDKLKRIQSFFVSSNAYLNGSMSNGPIDVNLIFQTFTDTKSGVLAALSDDFNSREAMALLMELISVCNKEFIKKGKPLNGSRNFETIIAVREYIEQLLTSLGLIFENHLPVESDLVNSDQTLSKIVDSSLKFRWNVVNYALLKEISPEEKDVLSKEEKKRLMEERKQLLKYCTDMREDFKSYGVLVNDHDSASSWTFHKKYPGSTKDDTVKKGTKKK